MIRRKFFKRLFIIYISFTLVYGFIISSYFVYQNKVSMDQKELDSKITATTQHARNIDQRIASFVKYVDTLYLDSDFNQYLVQEDDYYVVTKLYEKLRRDMSVFSDIEGRITLSQVEDDLYINNQSTMNKDMFIESYDLNSDEVNVVYDFYETGKNREYMVMDSDENINLFLITINAYSARERILVVQSVNKKSLANLNKDEFLNIYVHDGIRDRYEVNDGRLIVTKQSSVLPSVVYEFDFPYKKTSIFSVQFLVGILLYLVIVLIGSVIAMLIAKSTYKPISNIMDSFDEDNGEMIDEFAFLSRITKEIKDANTELNTTLIEQKIDLKTKIMRELIQGIRTEEQVSFITQDSNLSKLNKKSRVLLINIEEENDYDGLYLSDARNKIRKNIHTIIENALTLEGFFYELVELNQNQYCIILSDWQEDALKTMLNKMLNIIEVEEEVNIVIVVGSEVDSLLELNSSYEKARVTLDYRSNFDKRALIFYSDVEALSLDSVFFYPMDLERELIIYTLQGNNDHINQIFDRIYQFNFVDNIIENNEKRQLLMDMIGTLRRVYQKMRHKDETNEELELLKLFENNRYQEEELFDRLRITFLNYSDIVRQRSQSKAIEYSSEMIKYIQEHFNEDISLEEVATHLNLSTGYFSTIFKKETGENFKSYLNKYRVKKAKEILNEEPVIKIKDLTLRVGYFNVNSFIRMFKKYEGVSPGEYAKNMNKSG